VACLWFRWKGKEEPDLLSVAAIPDEPPDEIAAADHDRCIIPIKPESIDTWLGPVLGDSTLYSILDGLRASLFRPVTNEVRGASVAARQKLFRTTAC